MDENFEKGKQLLIEGLETYLGLLDPYLKLLEGIRLLGLWELLQEHAEKKMAPEDIPLLRMTLQSFLSDLKAASNVDEVREAVKRSGEFMKRIL